MFSFFPSRTQEYKLLRLIDLHDIHSVASVLLKKHTTAFAIVTKIRTYYVKARSSADADSWVDAINLARREVKEREEAREHRQATGGASAAPGMSRRATSTQLQQKQQNEYPQQQQQQQQQYRHESTSPSLSASSGGYAPVLSSASPFSLPPSVSSSISPLSSPPVTFRINPFQPAADAQQSNAASTLPLITSRNSTTSPIEIRHTPSPSSPTRGGGHAPNNISGATSSSEDDDDDDRNVPMSPTGGTGVMERRPSRGQPPIVGVGTGDHAKPVVVRDPNKVILSGYLMKMGKRKNWRKRWFVLTSGSLVYCSSHMVRSFSYVFSVLCSLFPFASAIVSQE